MYETLTVRQFLVGASSEAIGDILMKGIEDLDPNRVGACTEILLQRGHGLVILESLAKSGPIFLPAASTRCFLDCLQQSKNSEDIGHLTRALAYAFAHVDERLSADFNFDIDYLSPIKYLVTRRYVALDHDEFCSLYEANAKKDPRTPILNEDGKEIAYFLQLLAIDESPSQTFATSYRLAMALMRNTTAETN